MHDECEVLGLAHQVRPKVAARPRGSRRAHSPTETPFEHAIKPAIDAPSEPLCEGTSKCVALRSRSGSRDGMPLVQWLRGATLTPVSVAALGGSAGAGVVSLVSCLESLGGSPERSPTYQTPLSTLCSLRGSRHRFWRIGTSLNVGSHTGPSGSARKAGAQATATRRAWLTARLSRW